MSENTDLFADYKIPQGVYDECFGAGGEARPYWSPLLSSTNKLGMETLRDRIETMHQIIRENGISYNLYTSPRGDTRLWDMDLMPLVLAPKDWKLLEDGLTQRVQVLNHILSDLYGPQKLLADGYLPRKLVYGNPEFLTACHGIYENQSSDIQLYAVDLARLADGRWAVISDRIESPSGIGYALENRFITNQALQEPFRESGVMRLLPFLEQIQESFEKLSKRKTENPRIVLLSSGPGYESYFEHSFLARNLGYPLVVGADLMVRDHHVYLKTVNGIEPVDVIIRYIKSSMCDPLEGDSSSFLGIPGLIESARLGNVSIINPLGSGVLETPALSAFMNSLCERTMGEHLKIPSVHTWWCGDLQARESVIEKIDNLVFKPVFRLKDNDAKFGPQLNEDEKHDLIKEIRQNPDKWCAQSLLNQSTLPRFTEQGMDSTRYLLRMFLVKNGDSYSMMPGGLTRISAGDDTISVSLQSGGRSKDTWAIATPEEDISDHPIPNTGSVSLKRESSELTSRNAECLFWFGRYLERTEFNTRTLIRLHSLLNDDSSGIDVETATPFMKFLNHEVSYAFDKLDTLKSEDVDTLKQYMVDVWSSDQIPGSARLNIQNIQNNAFSIKEKLSVETANIVSSLEISNRDRPDGLRRSELQKVLNELSAIRGGIYENMNRSVDWRFLQVGRYLERAYNSLELLRYCLVSEEAIPRNVLQALLRCADSHYTYLSRYLTNLQVKAVIDLLLLDNTNPRSVAFQVLELRESIEELFKGESYAEKPDVLKSCIRMHMELETLEVSSLVVDKRKTSEEFHNVLEKFSQTLSELSEQIAHLYFTHTLPQSSLSRI